MWLAVKLSSSLCVFLPARVTLAFLGPYRSAVVCNSLTAAVEWDPHKLYCCIFSSSVFEVRWGRTGRDRPTAFRCYFVRRLGGRGAQCDQDQLSVFCDPRQTNYWPPSHLLYLAFYAHFLIGSTNWIMFRDCTRDLHVSNFFRSSVDFCFYKEENWWLKSQPQRDKAGQFIGQRQGM